VEWSRRLQRSGSDRLSRVVRRSIDSPRLDTLLGAAGLLLALWAFFKNPVAGAILLGAVVLVVGIVGTYSLYYRDRFGGLYELIKDEHVWDLDDETGRSATVVKHRDVRFLQDDVFALRDYFNGDGIPLDQSTSNPGEVAHYYSEEGRRNVIISLGETKYRDDTETFQITHRLRDSFLEDVEYVRAEVVQDTQVFILTVIFPRRRPATQAFFSRQKDGSREQLQILGRSDGRQEDSKTIHRPDRKERFVISWHW
jgi:hypothetical protein